MRQARGQMFIFMAILMLFITMMGIGGVEIARLAYARSVLQNAADAAAVAAASRLDPVAWREAGQYRFLPDVYSVAQQYATMNASWLTRRGIPVHVSQIWADPGRRLVFVALSADFSPLVPSLLPWDGRMAVVGMARAKADTR